MKQLDQVYETTNSEAVFNSMKTHEQVMFCNDPATGLQAIIAIHDTTLGPALGGTRMYPYASVEDALKDVLRLSEGMTYKCAAADIDFGGAKGVIIGDPKHDKSPAKFRAYGQFVESLNGRFYTGTDMGTTMDDFVHASKETHFINGLPEAYGGGGDSSIPTAKGVVYGLEATNRFLFGEADFGNRSYAVQGLGKVGFKVALHLLERGAKVYVTDIREDSIQLIQDRALTLGGEVHAVNQNDIFDVKADVFVPCALGGVLNDDTIPRLNAKAVVGSANNQLEAKRHAKALDQKGILYAPDFIVNAGGLIQVADELYGPHPERVLAKTAAIYDALLSIYERADVEGITTNEAADLKVQERLKEQAVRNSFFNRNRSPKWTIKE